MISTHFVQVAEFTASARRIIQDLCDLPKPVISAMDGIALGGGLEIALATDIRVAGTVTADIQCTYMCESMYYSIT